MKMLETDASDADVPVTLDDQMNINAFSKLNSRADEVADRVIALRQELEDLEEVETEMELMDEDEVILYKLDSSFLHLPAGEVLVLLQGSLTKLRAESDALATEKEECQSGMNDLKALLYAKFGSSINLERGD